MSNIRHSRIGNARSISRHVSSALPVSALRRAGKDVTWCELPAPSSAGVVISRAMRDILASVAMRPHRSSVCPYINGRSCLTTRCTVSVQRKSYVGVSPGMWDRLSVEGLEARAQGGAAELKHARGQRAARDALGATLCDLETVILGTQQNSTTATIISRPSRPRKLGMKNQENDNLIKLLRYQNPMTGSNRPPSILSKRRNMPSMRPVPTCRISGNSTVNTTFSRVSRPSTSRRHPGQRPLHPQAPFWRHQQPHQN